MRKFDYVENPTLVNLLPPEQSFVYRRTLDIDKKVAKELRAYMEKNFPEGQVYDRHPKSDRIRKLFGKSIIIFSIEYKGTSLLSWRNIPFKHFIVYDGTRTYGLSIDDYNDIKEELPKLFTVK